jgi:uncharacterized RDD family membrane protein YckC
LGLRWGAAILTCEQCGAEIPEGASFCSGCETPLSVAQIGPVYVPQSAQPPDIIPAIRDLAALPPRPAFAGFWLRAIAYLFDTILISLGLGLVASFYPSTFIKFPEAVAAAPPSLTSLPQLTPVAFAITIAVTWFYYTVFESSNWQATPGKRLLRIYVTDLGGRRLTFARAAARNIAKLISSLTFLVGYMVAGFTEKKQALHDILTSCLVLRRR